MPLKSVSVMSGTGGKRNDHIQEQSSCMVCGGVQMTFAELDAKLDPLLQTLNKARQARDALPLAFWNAVPYGIRVPVDLAFEMVEGLERWLAAQKAQEALRTPTGEADQDGQNAEEGHDREAQ